MIRKILVLALLALAGCDGDSSEDTAPTPPAVVEPPPTPVDTPPNNAERTTAVFIGDSMTSGMILPSGMINAGVWGNTSPEMLARFDADALSRDPRVVVILAGTNDVRNIRDANIDNVARMAELAAQDSACVILGTVPPIEGWQYTDYSEDEGNSRLAQWNTDIKDLASAHSYKVADYYSAMIRPDGTRDPVFFFDILHPSDAGLARMWEVVEPLITSCTESSTALTPYYLR